VELESQALLNLLCSSHTLVANFALSTGQSPDSLSERLGFSPDWNATLKLTTFSTPTLASFGSDARGQTSTQSSPRDHQAQQNSVISPRLLGGNISKLHNRNTSIFDGRAHSRTGSANSSAPLSPGIFIATGEFDARDGDHGNWRNQPSSSTYSMGDSANTQVGLNGVALPERTSSAADNINNINLTQKKVERGASGRSSRDHRKQPSHSRHHRVSQLCKPLFVQMLCEVRGIYYYISNSIQGRAQDCGRICSARTFYFGQYFNLQQYWPLSLTPSVPCPSGGENKQVYHYSSRPRTSNRTNMCARCRSDFRSAHIGIGAYCEPETKAFNRFNDVMAQEQE
jgi:hypothetical protein